MGKRTGAILRDGGGFGLAIAPIATSCSALVASARNAVRSVASSVASRARSGKGAPASLDNGYNKLRPAGALCRRLQVRGGLAPGDDPVLHGVCRLPLQADQFRFEECIAGFETGNFLLAQFQFQ